MPSHLDGDPAEGSGDAREKGTLVSESNRDLSRMPVSIDEANLVPNVGAAPDRGSGPTAGPGRADRREAAPGRAGCDSGVKALSVVGSALASENSIEDVAVLRHGAKRSLSDGGRAPSTVGSWLWTHKWSNVKPARRAGPAPAAHG